MTEPIIELKNVELSFENQIVHRDLSFKIQAGEGVTILGPSGTGKTLTLKMMIGLLTPTNGQIFVLGEELGALEEEQLRLVRQKIGMLFQGAALFDSFSVYENIAYGLREAGEVSEEKIRDIVQEKLSLVGLPGIGHKLPQELSGGQRKRVGLARALASSPDVLLFDEPTTGLDPTAIRLIDELIIRLKTEFGITCITVTHDIESARRTSERWILLDHGRVIADGEATRLAAEDEAVIDFISGTWKR